MSKPTLVKVFGHLRKHMAPERNHNQLTLERTAWREEKKDHGEGIVEGSHGQDCWRRDYEGGMKEVGLTSWGSDHGEEIV